MYLFILLNDNNHYTISMSDEYFLNIIENILNRQKLESEGVDSSSLANLHEEFKDNDNIFMNCFYQHDLIYKKYKKEILNFIKNHEYHYILTDGINSGDGNHEKFYMKDIVNTPIDFTKKYKNVLHLRLEDFVTHNIYIDKNRIINLLEKGIITDNLCIVCKKPCTDFEFEYINYITDYLNSKNITYNLEHNDVLTDYYIMKESEILICCKSTLSWCAAFFSDKIKKCFLPDYEITPNSTCKYPIDNTDLY